LTKFANLCHHPGKGDRDHGHDERLFAGPDEGLG